MNGVSTTGDFMNKRSFSMGSGIAGLSAALMLFAPLAFAAEATRADSEPVIATKAEATVVWRAAPKADAASAVTFTPLPDVALQAVQEENTRNAAGIKAKALKIGVNRNADTETESAAPALTWENTGDGHVARWAITSPGAKSMRAALRIRALPDDAELRFAGSGAPGSIMGVVSGKEANSLRDDGNVYWTPVTEGETQSIEIWLPSAVNPQDTDIRLRAVSHLFASALEGFPDTGLAKAAGACEIDVVCRNSLGSAFQGTASAVARMAFTTSEGSFVCTGTLLNDLTPDTQVPYFWSAAHCISTQSAANTLTTHWFYQAANCGGSSVSSNYRQLSGGAQILHVRVANDTLLLRLNNAPPSGATLAGWDAAAFSSGNVTAIHHPDGDFKKVSFGKGEGTTCSGINAGSGVNAASLSMVSWSEGTTEGGSSGSGLFTTDDGRYYLRGGLMGGFAACSNVGGSLSSGNLDCYSSLNLVWNDIQQWLGAPTATPNASQYIGQWGKTNPNNEEGWGLTVIANFPNNPSYLFVPWYTYDRSGNASWLLLEGASWTNATTFTADVRRISGPAWGSTFDSNRISATVVGTATLTFSSATSAQFQYNVDGVNRTISLRKLQ
jgi:hypothetical protein